MECKGSLSSPKIGRNEKSAPENVRNAWICEVVTFTSLVSVIMTRTALRENGVLILGSPPSWRSQGRRDSSSWAHDNQSKGNGCVHACVQLFLYQTLRGRCCPLSVCVFSHQLTQSRQLSTDVPTGQSDLDNPHCNSAKILDRVTMAIKINHHRFPPK